MARPIRPVNSFVLRLWREPGDQESDATWRGMIRPLESRGGAPEALFHGLGNLLEALRPYLEAEDLEEKSA